MIDDAPTALVHLDDPVCGIADVERRHAIAEREAHDGRVLRGVGEGLVDEVLDGELHVRLTGALALSLIHHRAEPRPEAVAVDFDCAAEMIRDHAERLRRRSGSPEEIEFYGLDHFDDVLNGLDTGFRRFRVHFNEGLGGRFLLHGLGGERRRCKLIFETPRRLRRYSDIVFNVFLLLLLGHCIAYLAFSLVFMLPGIRLHRAIPHAPGHATMNSMRRPGAMKNTTEHTALPFAWERIRAPFNIRLKLAKNLGCAGCAGFSGLQISLYITLTPTLTIFLFCFP